MFDDNPMIIVVSDIHLGGGSTKFEEIIKFFTLILQKLKNDTKFAKNLKAIIILGDFLDVLMDSVRRITHIFQALFVLINQIQENGVEIIYVLGNHEISVSGNYNKTFNSQKRTLLEKLQLNDCKMTFLDDFNICQYVSLTHPDNMWELALYDAVEQIEQDPIRTINFGLENKTPAKKRNNVPIKYLMTHGYQFYRIQTQLFAITVWNNLLEAKDSTKETINRVYNESGVYDVIKAGREITDGYIKKILEKFKEKNSKKKDFIKNKIESIKNVFLKKILLDMGKSDNLRNKIKNDEKKILAYLKKKLRFALYNNVIYGHTHEMGENTVKGIHIMNTGAWQHVAIPSYIEIYSDGKASLKEFQ
jgi:UDP-2,3-diacylglucosamine pyrophosphatase LpxH